MTEEQLRGEICRVGRSLFERGYVHATAGNISVRLPDGFLITPSDAYLGFLEPAKLARVDVDGTQTSGDRASKTLALHRAIYQADAGAMCVLHTHATHLVALSMTVSAPADDLLQPITPYFVMKVGHVPLLPYFKPGDAAVPPLVVNEMRKRQLRAVMLPRLGPVVWHDSPANAMAVLEEMEETAKLRVLLGKDVDALDEDEIEALRTTFGARW